MRELEGNMLLLQIGVPSAMTNVILSELIQKALNYVCIEEIYGCIRGIQGLLSEQFINLADQPQKNILHLTGTPGAALKTGNFVDVDCAKIIEILRKKNIKYLFIVSDKSGINLGKQIDLAAKKGDYKICLILIPTSSSNDIPLTDHCLGYGSMAKHLAVTTKNIISFVQSTQQNGAITILEMQNCDNAWLLGSLALARHRKDSIDAPHLVILSKFDEGTFVKNVGQLLRTLGNCVIVVGTKLTNLNDDNLLNQRTSAEYLKFISEANFDVAVDIIRLHDWQLTSCMTLSETDVAESRLCAQKALELSITIGVSGKMVTLLRSDNSKYSSEVNCVDLENIPIKEKEFPEAWYKYEEMVFDVPFFKYASPLIVGEVYCSYENGLPILTKFKI